MKQAVLLYRGMQNPGLSLATLALSSCLLWLSHFIIASNTHGASPITPSGLDTHISAPLPATGGEFQYNITGGTRAGTNLFHSFSEFNVPTNHIANFLNDSGQTTINVLGRVTGGNPSSIFGTIQTTGFGDANLFLMNPSGIVFGPTASVNVGGSVTFTTADYLRLNDNVRFNTIPNANADALLSTAPVAAYGFLDSTTGSISVQGSQFKMSAGYGISLIGGNITIQSGTLANDTVSPAHLSAPEGEISLVSVTSPGEILAGTLEQASNINGQLVGSLGTIKVLERSVIDVGGNGGGTVRIRGGQFLLDNSTISANITGPGPVTNGVESIGGGINIRVDQDSVIQNLAVLETNVTGNVTPGVTYGAVHVEADHIEILGTISFEEILAGVDPDPFPFTGIRSNVLTGSTSGNSGTITLEGNSILVRDSGQLQTLTKGIGNAGSITMRATQNLDSNVGLIASKADNFATGDAGSIELTSTQGNISLTNATTITSQTVTSPGAAGNITLNAPRGNILLADSSLGTLISPPINLQGVPAVRTGGSGEVRITTNNLQLNGSGIAITNLSNLPPGNLTINLSGNLSLNPSSVVQTPTRSSIEAISRGPADSSGLTIIAHDILISDGSSLTTETLDSGDAGPLTISAVNLHMTNGGQIKSGSRQGIDPNTGLPVPFLPSGSGGLIKIQGQASSADSILIDGQRTVERTGQQIVIPSGIISNAEGTGPAGKIDVSANSVTLQNGGTISALTKGFTPRATGGSIIINATDQVTLTNGATITASSTVIPNNPNSGISDAGNIKINAGQQLEVLDKSSITTQAGKASGGNIDIRAIDRIRFVNSTVSTSVLAEDGKGGNIFIDPNVVILEGSEVTAKAVGGAGGNITFVTPLFLADSVSLSLLSAKSESGLNGTVTIQSPTSNLSGTVGQLSSKTNPPQVLLQNRCVALAGSEQSTFILAGRDALPSQPGGWLSSPVVMEHWTGENMEEHASGLMVRRVEPRDPSPVMTQANGTGVLSLRRLTPSGFLVRSFADRALTGCRS